MAATAADSLQRLEGLQRDLVNLVESKLPNVQRLWVELESRVDEFRALLKQKPKDNNSLQAISSGTITIDDEQYSINDEFKQDVIQLSDALGLDELEAAKLYLQAQRDIKTLDRSALAAAFYVFHRRRQFLLDCLRICLQQSLNLDFDDQLGGPFRKLISLILASPAGQAASESSLWREALYYMRSIEVWLRDIAERVQSNSIIGQTQSAEFDEVMQFQRHSLTKQHESLGAIAFFLAKGRHMNFDDVKFLMKHLQPFDRYDVILVHYLPTLIAAIALFGPTDGNCSLREARLLDHLFTSQEPGEAWDLRQFKAAAVSLWIAEYSGRYLDGPSGSPLEGVDLEAEAEGRANTFSESLRDGSFQFLLTICRDVANHDWIDKKRRDFTYFLIHDGSSLQSDPFTVEPYFKEILMDQFQYFAEAFITNMPDTLRKLRFDEDEQRREMQGRRQLRPSEFNLHFERFLMIIAYAFDGQSAAAEAFWSDLDGNLFGFLQWASQRQSTPRVAAFCEMLWAISQGQENADAAHKFLLEGGSTSSGKLRRTSPLSWTTIFNELEFYSSAVRERTSAPPDKTQPDEYLEPESPMMLDCYLRLVAHLTTESSTARYWLLTHSTFRIHEHLLSLCGGSTDSRLRACAFSALESLLTEKTQEVSDGMWTALDAWISGALVTSMNLPRVSQAQPSITTERMIFDSIAVSIEESNEFVRLLCALARPYQEGTELNDALPFPESLGAAYRMPGIEPFVDFAMGQVFGVKSNEAHDQAQLRLIRLSCLEFASVCLGTFNEDLVVFANQSSISVDSAIRTSSLAAYARLHPFARIMEWLFNDKVIAALFSAVQQDVAEVNGASPDSPLVLSILRGLQVIDLIMTLQATYFDIVRPIVKVQSGSRRTVVANAALASFEDVILNNLNVVTTLGLYSGSGHQQLALLSLKLLEKFSSSRKLAAPPERGASFEKSRLLTTLERNDDVEGIALSLTSEMQFDDRELEQGFASPGFVIKTQILDFLNACMTTVSNRPNLAHLFLGFTCYGKTLDVSDDSPIARNTSLLQAVINLLVNCPFQEGDTMTFWLLSIKNSAMLVLRQLLKSSLSASLVLTELRNQDFLFAQWLRQPVISSETTWNGLSFYDAQFFVEDSAVAYVNFLEQQTAFLHYVAAEVRTAHTNNITTLKTRIATTLMGRTLLPDGNQIQNQTVFDLIKFLDLDVSEVIPLPDTKYFNPQDFLLAKVESDNIASKNDVRIAEQLLILRQIELRNSGKLSAVSDEQQAEADAQNILLCLHADNRRIEIRLAHSEMLKAWVQLVVVMLECCDLDPPAKRSVIFQALQLTLPYLERSISEGMTESLVLVQLGRILLDHVDFSLLSSGEAIARDSAGDRLLHLFRVSLLGIQYPDTTAVFRETCYQICQGYLRGILNELKNTNLRHYALQSVQSSSDRLIQTVCDDASAGVGNCRISALLFLGTLVTTSNRDDPKPLIESFDSINFIEVMVDSIRAMSEIQEDDAGDVAERLSYYDTTLALLLCLSQTRFGATHVTDAGLFAAIRDSGLFAADPDIGIEIDNPKALAKYYKLILSALRIINAVVMSMGSENDQTINQARKFLQESRQCMVAIFKRNAKIGSVAEGNQETLQDLVENFSALISASDFLDDPEEMKPRTKARQLFT